MYLAAGSLCPWHPDLDNFVPWPNLGTPMSTPEVVREVQSLENYNPLAKQKAAAKLSRIPIKV